MDLHTIEACILAGIAMVLFGIAGSAYYFCFSPKRWIKEVSKILLLLGTMLTIGWAVIYKTAT